MTNENEKSINRVYFPQPPICPIDGLLDGLIASHEPDNYVSPVDKEKASTGMILLLCMTDTLVFNPSMLYDVLSCDTAYNIVSKHLSRLCKRGMIKAAAISADKEIQTVYYLTKAGYEQVAPLLSNCKPFKNKTGKRLSETARHDYGVSCGYLSFVRSPFTTSVTYEVSNMFEKASMPSGKFMRRSLRPDAVISISSDLTFGKCYLEHDTGSEQTIRMIDKLNLYQDHGILHSSSNGCPDEAAAYEQNSIIYTFRKAYMNKPDCFSYRQLERLAAVMSDDQTVDDITDAAFASLLKDLRQWTPAFKKHWKKQDITGFAGRVKNRTDLSLVRYQKYYQRNGAAARRNSALRILIDEYKKGRESSFHTAITEMLKGYPVGFCPYNGMDNLLPFLYMPDYPQIIRWVENVLQPYYGEITYRSRCMQFTSNKAGGQALGMTNVFGTSTDELVCVEYISCDLSALMRMYLILQSNYDLGKMPFRCVYVVDSYKDADRFLTMLNPMFRLGETVLKHNDCYDIVFLSISGKYLFTISPEGNEVMVKP